MNRLIEDNQRLQEILSELGALKDHLQLIEKQIAHDDKIEKRRLDNLSITSKLSREDQEMQDAVCYYNYRINFLLPHILRAPFLVSLYAVYEAAMMQKRQSQPLSMDDIQGNMLEKAKTYYKHILKFDLYVDQTDWQRINMLSDLRHAIAHRNGRIRLLKKSVRNKIAKWEHQKIGLSCCHGYIIIQAQLAENLLESVRASLRNLHVRYKKWNKKLSIV